MPKEVVFLSLCFFTLGFLTIVSFISIYLFYYFRLKVYLFYVLYVFSTAVFIGSVFVVNSHFYSEETLIYKSSRLIYDSIQILIFYFHTSFICNAILLEMPKYKKYYWLIQFYTVLVIIHILMAIFLPEIVNNHGFFFSFSRILLLVISLPFFFFLIKERKNDYFKYLIAACLTLVLFGLVALWDATINRNNSVFKGFQFICFGYILENLCFVSAFVYRIITIDKKKKADDILHQKQLILVQSEMQQQTMNQIGQEIHDNVGQKLTLASLYTQQLSYENKVGQNATIESVSAIINESLSELRRLSKSLTDDTIDSTSIMQLFENECDKIRNLNICEVDFSSNQLNTSLSYQSKTVLFRMAQEFFQNSIKHSNCKKIRVALIETNNSLQLTMADDGKGFDLKTPSNGIGLKNMKNRIAIINGTYSLSSTSEGTKMIVSVPI